MKRISSLLFCITLSLFAFSQSSDAYFSIQSVTKLDKSESLADEKRNTFAKISQEQWDNLPVLIEVKIEFEPLRD